MLNPEKMTSPILFRGDEHHAWRDPAAFYRDGMIHLFMTLTETEDDGRVFMYVAHSTSRDLLHWTEPEKLTVRDRSKNFSSPGNVVDLGDRFLLCFQTYCRENGEKFGNENCRIWFSESTDLQHWDPPYPVCLKGDKPLEEQGRMIDPYLIFDEKTGLWNCFFKQNGISRSTSQDLKNWTFRGRMDGGENVSVIKKGETYYLFASPQNGISVQCSEDMENWRDAGLLTFGQDHWLWARGRITAGTAIEVPGEDGEPLYLMFFHGSGPQDESVSFDIFASVAVAWSRDLMHWQWKD